MKNFLDNLDQNVKTRTDGHGQVTQYRYDSSNRLLQTIYPDGTSEETFYNVAGQAAWRTDRHSANQAVVLGTKTIHDSAGRATVNERRSGVVISVAVAGEVASATVTNQGTALWSESSVYDAAGRVEVSVDKHGQITNYEFDNMGRAWKTLAPPVMVWNPLGGNGMGEMASMRPTTETTYDDLGRVKTVKDPTGRVTTSIYDELGRVVRTDYPSTAAHGVTNTQATYDSLGRKVTETDQLGKVTRYEYDVLGNLTAVIQPAVDDAETVETTLVNPRYEYTYNHLGEQLTQTDAEGRTTSYDYDDFGRRTTRTLPGSAVETTAYDRFGRVTTKIDFKGQVEEFVYDDDVRVPIAQRLNLGRVIQKRYYASAGASEDTSQRVSYTYDSLGRTATLIDSRGTTTYTYDGEGRETQVASPEGTINYVYGTAAGNGKDRLIRTYTAHDDQSYTYDALGRLATVTANVIRGVTLNEAGNYVYDLNGNLRSWSLTGRAGALHVYSYDELNRLTTLTRQNFTEPMTWNYATDKVGRKTTDNAKFRWEYDALGRLTREQYDINGNFVVDSGNDYVTTFGYDLVGNRKKRVTDKVGTASDETTTYVYNSRDELTSETSTLSGSTTYVYDANGSLTSKTKGAVVETYGYDKRNKMTSYTSSSGVTTTYKYDDEGLRVQRKVGTAAATLYLFNHHNLTGYPVVMEERSGTSTSMPTVAYVVGHDVLRQSQDAAGTGTTDGHLHLIYDGQGNVRGNVGTVNVGPTSVFVAVGGLKDYTAFGELIGGGSLVSNLRHHGEYFDGITGFYFQGVRQRVTHWWMQRDPYQGTLWLPLTLHGHNFVHGDPINGKDPTGKFFSLIDVMMSGGIDSVLSTIQGFGGRIATNTTINASRGIGVNQALTLAMIDAATEAAKNAALGVGIFWASRALAILARCAGQKLLIPAIKYFGKKVDILPGIMIIRGRSRLIPGTPGYITGGSSAALRANLLEANGLPRTIGVPDEAAHHIIPLSMRDSAPVLKRIGMDMDHATNGMMLPTNSPRMHYHNHPAYRQAMEDALNDIPDNIPLQEQMRRVSDIQQRAGSLLMAATPLEKRAGATRDMWYQLLTTDPI